MPQIRIAVKALIVKDNKVLLLIRKRKSPQQKPVWDIPGGGLLAGETFEQALKREVTEETNLDIEILDIIRAWNNIDNEDGRILYGITYAARYIGGSITLSDEHETSQWVDIKDIASADLPSWIKDETSILQKRNI